MTTLVAAIQICSSDSVAENLTAAKDFIVEAARNQAKLIVLPEMFACMSSSDTAKMTIKEPFGKGDIQSFLANQAQENNVWIVGGTIPIESTIQTKTKAACLVFNPKGQCVARYDKIHLFDVVLSDKESYQESSSTVSGDKIVVLDTPFGKIGLAVCYDLRFPELFRSLFNKGAEIIIVPSAFIQNTGQAHWEVLARSRAIENGCYFIGACQGGVHANGRRTFGDSLIVDPWGAILAQKKDLNPGVIYAHLDLDKLHAVRKSLPMKAHQRIFIDSSQF